MLRNEMAKSLFKNDLKNEKVINCLINRKLQELKIVDEVIEGSDEENFSGVDFKLKSPKLFGDNEVHCVDYKAATNNRAIIGEKSLNTFAFEVAYSKQTIEKKSNQKIKETKSGWLFGDKYNLTEYYLLAWIWVHSEEKCDKKITLEEKDIAEIEIMIIKKENIIDYLSQFKLTKENFSDVVNRFKEVIKEKDNELAISIKYDAKENLRSAEISIAPEYIQTYKYYKDSTGKEQKSVFLPKLYYSKYLREEPVNVLIAKTELKKLSIKGEGHKKFDF